MYVYKITNVVTGLSYIGKCQNDDPHYMGSGTILWNSYRKRFGNPDLDCTLASSQNWVYQQNQKLHLYVKEVLEICDDVYTLNRLEDEYIVKFNTIWPGGYNIARGGHGGNLVAGYSEEQRKLLNQKISENTKAAMNRPDVRQKLQAANSNKSEEWKLHLSESLKGKPGHPCSEYSKQVTSRISKGNKWGLGNKSKTGMKTSETTKRKISESVKLVPHTDEWNRKVSESLKGKKRSEEHKQKLRKPKPKYVWLLPDGTTRIMDKANAAKHPDWVELRRLDQ